MAPVITIHHLYQLSYQANWKLVILWIPIIPPGWKWSVCSSYIWTVDKRINKWDNHSHWFSFLTAIVAHLLLLIMDCILINKRKLLLFFYEVKRTKSCKQTIREKKKHVTGSPTKIVMFSVSIYGFKKPSKFFFFVCVCVCIELTQCLLLLFFLRHWWM